MATVNFIPEHKQNQSAMKGVINYCLQEKKTTDKISGKRLIGGINCNGENAYEEFMTTKHVYEKANGVFFYHYDQAFHPNEKVTAEEVHQIGLEFAKRAWPGHEVLVATHTDEPQLHSHFVINSVSFETGAKLRQDVHTLKRLRKISDEICTEHNLSVLKPYDGGGKKISAMEYRVAMKGDSRKFRLINEIERAMKLCGNKKEFIAEMNKRGYEVRWTDERQNITYTCPGGMKCRDKRLHENKFLKARMEYEFEIRCKLTGELGNANESEKCTANNRDGGRTVQTDTLCGEKGAARCGVSNAKRGDRVSAGALSYDKQNCNENGNSKYVADDDGKFAGGEPNNYEQPDINQCDNGGEDGEFVETGWECEREIYFEILKGNGCRNRKTEGYDRYAEEKSAEVFGDYSWDGNNIFGIGVGALTALASLTDDDKDDDEKERKRKTDAKYAASNLGFALGGAASLAAYLLTKKQDENINEINSETNEESENLYEDDEFKMDM